MVLYSEWIVLKGAFLLESCLELGTRLPEMLPKYRVAKKHIIANDTALLA
jgi:hypothetical protein